MRYLRRLARRRRSHLSPSVERGAIVSGVASVIDGDTVEIHGQRIRLYGIDAPEASQPCDLDGKPWRCGQVSANALAEYIARRPVTCEPRDRDRYGRLVAACSVAGANISAWMVSEGWAVAYEEYSQDFVADEATAHAAKRGIWRSSFIMPWKWRAQRRAGGGAVRQAQSVRPHLHPRAAGPGATSRATSIRRASVSTTYRRAIVTRTR